MPSALPVPFPKGFNVSKDINPAIRLFGKRFIVDQSIPEYLVEFLLIAYSEKTIGQSLDVIKTPLPSFQQIKSWPEAVQLSFKPTNKLNLKLFSFLSSSRIDTRHKIHRDQFAKLWDELKNRTHSNRDDAEDVIEWLEELLRGFKAVGFNRTWCAQVFFPIASSLLIPETIWNETKAKNNPVDSWERSLVKYSTYYSTSSHNFLARGGEVLYLQLCNVFAQEQEKIDAFAKEYPLNSRERNLITLHEDLQRGFMQLYGGYERVLNNLVEYIENIDPETKQAANNRAESSFCEWCPEDSWREGFLFAVELKRLLLTSLDPVEKLELMMTGCALQVLRSLCAQTVRYSRKQTAVEGDASKPAPGGGLYYSWVFSPAAHPSRHLLLTSQRNLRFILTLIQRVLRDGALIENLRQGGVNDKDEINRRMKDADTKYGFKLFLSLGKRLGIIVPHKGPGARFVMTDSLLRYFILTLLEPRNNCSYEDFLDRLYANHGIAVEGDNLRDSIAFSNLPPNLSTEYDDSSWLREMLRAGGFLTELSDGYSIVSNTFETIEQGE